MLQSSALLTHPVHPRVRGEQHIVLGGDRVAIGSSPRARGAEDPRPAGPHRRPVHPRVRGEQAEAVRDVAAINGSSPRARGAAKRPSGWRPDFRFIPACAGSSDASGTASRWCAVHPRVRGEQAYTRTGWPASTGSSPRARGAAVVHVLKLQIDRFIPACAGSRPPTRQQPARRPVHPRVRGEQQHGLLQRIRQYGSSPHARGAVQAFAVMCDIGRFIPACAGSRPVSLEPIAPSPVHPRVRGEQTVCW